MRTIETRPEKKVDTKICRITRFDSLGGDVPDDTLSLGYAKYACNVKLGNGFVSAARGLQQARVNGTLLPTSVSIGSGIEKAFFYRKFNAQTHTYEPIVLYQLRNNEVYKASVYAGQLERLNVGPVRAVEFTNFHRESGDLVVMLDGNAHIMTFDGTSGAQIDFTPALRQAAAYNDKLFALDADDVYKIRFSAKNDPLEWDDTTLGAGSIRFTDDGGELKKVVVCGDSLYVFRDYSVYRLTAYTDINSYSLTRVLSTQGKIYPKTVGVWDNTMYFYTENGFYSVKGNTVRTLWKDEFTLIDDASNAAGYCYGGQYLITARLKTDENGAVGDEASCRVNTGFLAIDIQTPGVEISRGTDVIGFTSGDIDGKNYLFFLNATGLRGMHISMWSGDEKLYGNNWEKRWYSPVLTLGGMRLSKTIRNVHIRVPVAMRVAVLLDGIPYTYDLNGSAVIQTLPVNKCGNTLQLYVSGTDDGFRMSGFEIEYETTERRGYGL